jgi:predicted ATPase
MPFVDSSSRLIAKPQGGLARAVEARRGFRRITSLHAHGSGRRLKLEVRLRIGSNEWGYQIALSGRKNQPALVESETVLKNGQSVMSERPNPTDKKDPRLLQQTHLEQVSQNAPFRELADALASVDIVHVIPQVAKSTSGTNEDTLRNSTGSDFIERLATLPKKKQRGSLNRIQALLKVAVPQFSRLEITREKSSGRPHLEAAFEHWRLYGSWQNEQEFSDGTLRLIGLLWAILDGDNPLLLEEPELSLHEEVVKQLPRMLAKAGLMKDRQIIVSTHSEVMLNDRGIDPREIIVLVPTAQGTEARLASNDPGVLRGAMARLPLGSLVSAVTRPAGIEQLSLSFPK